MVMAGGTTSIKDNIYLNKYFLSKYDVLDILLDMHFSAPSVKNILFELLYVPDILVGSEITVVSKRSPLLP